MATKQNDSLGTIIVFILKYLTCPNYVNKFYLNLDIHSYVSFAIVAMVTKKDFTDWAQNDIFITIACCY